jgi:hypothetical protein
MTTKIFEGILFGWFETGTEGILWALQEHKYIYQTGGLNDGPHWDHKGLQVLRNGDRLKIYDENKILLHDIVVDLDNTRQYKSLQQKNTYWVHGMQKSFHKEFWWNIFASEKCYGILEREE